jgi:hypothetical protein
MRAGILGLGTILSILGIILVLLLWPFMGYETQETFEMDDVKEDSTIKYVGEITDIGEFAGIYVLELDHGALEAFTDSGNFDLNDQVVVTIEFGGNTSNWDENTYTVEKIPTMGGIYGTLFFFIGLVMCLVGLITKKASLMDAVEFSIKPPTQIPSQGAVQSTAFDSSASQLQPASVHDEKGDEVTCPKCRRIFKVSGKSRPMKITCPECGVEGILK